MRITNRATNGRRVTVFGYGACGKGVAANFRNAGSQVSVIETDPVLRLEANFDGFAVPDREVALAMADVVVTVTGARDVVTAEDLHLLHDDVVLLNGGHFPAEIAVGGICADERVKSVTDITDGITTIRLHDGRRIHLLTDGHMVNLAGPRPLGNSIESMDIGFALQARCLEAVAGGRVGAESVVVPVPRFIDEAVSEAYLATT
jgi:adenosylhomocysteinase